MFPYEMNCYISCLLRQNKIGHRASLIFIVKMNQHKESSRLHGPHQKCWKQHHTIIILSVSLIDYAAAHLCTIPFTLLLLKHEDFQVS